MPSPASTPFPLYSFHPPKLQFCNSTFRKARSCFGPPFALLADFQRRKRTEEMKFAVKAWSNSARVGALEIGNCPGPVETPALLLSTRKGLPHFISPDLLYSLPSPDSHLLQVCPLHFLEGLSTNTISKLGGLHQMLYLREYGIAAVLRDSIQCLPESSASSKIGASFETPCGRLLIKPREYVEMISCMRPNIWATLADEVPAWVSDKRNKASVDRTIKWLDDCLALNKAGGAVFGAIVGGPNLEERKRCAEEVTKRDVSAVNIPATLPPITQPLGPASEALRPPVQLLMPPLSDTQYDPDRDNISNRP